jgi:hypothetical protein
LKICCITSLQQPHPLFFPMLHCCPNSLIAVHSQRLPIHTIAFQLLLMILQCNYCLSAASASTPQAHVLHRAVLHSVQSIPIAAFPSSEMIKRRVPYQVTNSSNPCSFEIGTKRSPLDDARPLRVVPPYTGYPRASTLDNGGDCSDDFDLCSQAFQVTLQVSRTRLCTRAM